MAQVTHEDTVLLAVPSQELMSRVVRLATTAVASRAGLNIDQADDLNTALDELFRKSIGDKPHKDFCVLYEIHEDRLEIVVKGCVIDGGKDNMGRYSRFLLESLSDKVHEVESAQGGKDVVLVKHLCGQR